MVLVDPYKNYQLYFRDPKTRKFIAIQTMKGQKYKINFDAPYWYDDKTPNYLHPEKIILTEMLPGKSRMYSREIRIKEWNIKQSK